MATRFAGFSIGKAHFLGDLIFVYFIETNTFALLGIHTGRSREREKGKQHEREKGKQHVRGTKD